jgi:hypothetical protein
VFWLHRAAVSNNLDHIWIDLARITVPGFAGKKGDIRWVLFGE